MNNKWEILIPTIPHRHELLCKLLSEINRQWQPGLGVVVFRDNLENSLIHKQRALVENSQADYISFLDDDDWIAPNFVSRIMESLSENPDYVGFQVRWTVDGVEQVPIDHSLRYPGWNDVNPVLLFRDITQLNPMKRELMFLVPWGGEDHGSDRAWAAKMRETGQVRTEVYINSQMYYYRYSTADHFTQKREPLPENDIPPLPAYPWVRSL